MHDIEKLRRARKYIQEAVVHIVCVCTRRRRRAINGLFEFKARARAYDVIECTM